jgi:hypothetical protein
MLGYTYRYRVLSIIVLVFCGLVKNKKKTYQIYLMQGMEIYDDNTLFTYFFKILKNEKKLNPKAFKNKLKIIVAIL